MYVTLCSFLVATASMALEYSKGDELSLLDDENTPLHLLVHKITPAMHLDFPSVGLTSSTRKRDTPGSGTDLRAAFEGARAVRSAALGQGRAGQGSAY
jgi:hypothetical protein